MKLIYMAIIALGLFVAVWMLFVMPSERRHHERKLEMIRKNIEKRQAALEQRKYEASPEDEDDQSD